MTRNATQIRSALKAHIRALRRAVDRFNLASAERNRSLVVEEFVPEVDQKHHTAPAADGDDPTWDPSQKGVLATIAANKKPSKGPLNTYATTDTLKRLEWVKNRGHAVTDVVELALHELFDRAGVPAADAIGEEPQTVPGASPRTGDATAR